MNQLSEVIETASFPAVAREFPGGRILAITGRTIIYPERRQYRGGFKEYSPQMVVKDIEKLKNLIEMAKRLDIARLQFRIQTAAGKNVSKTFDVNKL